jgi:hypothetical protein
MADGPVFFPGGYQQCFGAFEYGYQEYVPTDPGRNVVSKELPWCWNWKTWDESLLLATTTTILPPGVLKATLGNVEDFVDAMRTEPGRTNFEK